jgi:hypothetical protein
MIKQLIDLTFADFSQSPRWMFYAGKNGEHDPFVTVIPESHEDFDGDQICLIRAAYSTCKGLVLDGFYYDDNQREDHTVFFGKECISTWRGMQEPSDGELKAIYQRIGVVAQDLFPLNYRSYDGKRCGTIAGFYFIGKDNNIRDKK